MQRLLIIIVAIVVLAAQMIVRARRKQQKSQSKRESPLDILTRAPWEFETPEEAPAAEDSRIRVETRRERTVKSDDEFRKLADESTVSDEEAFSEETVVQKRPPKPEPERPLAPTKRTPARIAGIPINPRTISQGVIISEILRRPKF